MYNDFIVGMQKLTLLDYPGKTACILFTKKCNMKCVYCQNYELVEYNKNDHYTKDEILKYLKDRKNLLDGVVISGGEPTIWNLEELLSNIKELGYDIKLDTNGRTNPMSLYKYIDRKLVDYIAMDIKAPLSKYENITLATSIHLNESILNSINIIINNASDYEFRTTVVDEYFNKEDFHEIATMIKGAKQYYLQPFVDSDNVPIKGLHSPSIERLEEYAEIVRNTVDFVGIRGLK